MHAAGAAELLSWYLPPTHCEHAVVAVVYAFPAEQNLHATCASATWALSTMKRPAEQAAQVAFAVVLEGWNWPASHTRHADAVSTNARPASQILHDGMVAVFSSWYLPAGQGRQLILLVMIPIRQLRRLPTAL